MLMRRLIYLRAAGRDVHLPKLIGALVLFAAVIMFFQTSAAMFNSWDNVKYVDGCLNPAKGPDALVVNCTELAKDSLGVSVRADQDSMTLRQKVEAIAPSVAGILFWLAALFAGFMVYRTGQLVLPIEEEVKMLPDRMPAAPKKKPVKNPSSGP